MITHDVFHRKVYNLYTLIFISVINNSKILSSVDYEVEYMGVFLKVR